MSSWHFAPQYRFYLIKPNPLRAYSLTTLMSCQALLATDGAVGQLQATFADPGQKLRGAISDPSLADSGPTPHAMNTVQLWLQNRDGQWGKAWTGYVDEAHFVGDPDQGEMLHLLCTSPAKLWEIGHVDPSDAQTLAVADALNVAATSILQLSAQKVGFPSGMLVIDPNADTGPGLQYSAIQTSATTPEEQTWSAVMQALLANTGLEWFFDGAGKSHWRRVGFLGNGGTPRVVRRDDILHADLSESDQGVVTTIEVRPGYSPFIEGAAIWQAPAGMVAGLRQRRIVIYAPWILSGQPAAQALADMLGQQYSAGLLQGSLTLPADPLYGVGTVARIPTLHKGSNALSDYYIGSVSYTLQWGSQWVMTLGLRYGRSPEQSYPFVGTLRGYPTPTTQSGVLAEPLSTLTGLTFESGHRYRATNSFRVVAAPALADRQVSVDPAIIPVGTVLQVDKPDGTPLFGSGEFTAVAGTQTGYVLGIKGVSAANVRITLIPDMPATGTATSTTAPAPPPSPDLTTSGTGFGTSRGAGLQTIYNPNTLALQAMAAALAQAPGRYVLGAAGPAAWDCSGLVYWAYTSVGYHPPGWSHRGPDGEYDWFSAHGARAIAVADAQPGDLLFIKGPEGQNNYTASQRGFSHVGWLYQPGITYGANNEHDGLCTFPISVFKDFFGYSINLALDMSRVPLTS